MRLGHLFTPSNIVFATKAVLGRSIWSSQTAWQQQFLLTRVAVILSSWDGFWNKQGPFLCAPVVCSRLDGSLVNGTLLMLWAVANGLPACLCVTSMIHRHLGLTPTWTKPPAQTKRPSKKPQVTPQQLQGEKRPLTWDIELEQGHTNKRQRRASRRKTVAANNPNKTLRNSSVGPGTLVKYQHHWHVFKDWCSHQVHEESSPQELDLQLSLYLEELYLAGEDLSVANYVTAAVMFHVPGCKSMKGLPKSQQSMRGWRRLCPPRSRLPVPYEVVCLLAQEAVRQDQLELGLAMLVIFLMYLRPGELFRLRVQDIVEPVQKAGKAYRSYSLLLHPGEIGIPSKTFQWDEMLSMDLPHLKFLGPAMKKHLRLASRKKGEKAFAVTLEQLNNFVSGHWEELGLKPLGQPHLYRFRHGGASFEAANRLRSLESIQARGRWQTLKSLKNYEKGGRLPQLFASLSKATQRKCVAARKDIERIFRCQLWARRCFTSVCSLKSSLEVVGWAKALLDIVGGRF